VISDALLSINRKVDAALSRQEGQGMVEYGLIIALVALVVIGALVLLGGQLSTIFSQITSSLNT
jgi:pilus assembly protein Flp/PilA